MSQPNRISASNSGLAPALRMAPMCVDRPSAAMAMASSAVSISVVTATTEAGSHCSELNNTTATKPKAAESGTPLLGQIPMEPSVSVEGDAGEPVALREGAAGDAFRALAARIVDEAVPQAEMAGCSARMLDAAMANLDALEL